MSDSNSSPSSNEEQRAILLARVNFPIYCIKAISERHILVGGGGGTSKTGITNPFEIYELIYDESTNNARATLATHHDVGADAIMNMCVIPQSKYIFEVPCGGLQGMCHVYEVKFRFKNGFNKFPVKERSDSSSSNQYLRRRHFSLSSQHSSVEDIEENSEEIIQNNELNYKKTDERPSNDTSKNTSGKPTDDQQRTNIPDYVFDFELKESFQTDFHQQEPYQKLIKYSPNAQVVFTAGADGHITFWQLPSYSKLERIKAHENEIDDLDVHPTGHHIVSASRDGHAKVWSVTTGKLITVLDHSLLIPRPTSKEQQALMATAKYNPRLCRYSTVEGNDNEIRLFVALNTRSKLNSYICKWNVRQNQYRQEKIVSAGDAPSFAMAISDEGRFLAIGKQNGDVDVYISFSLQRCYHFSQAHNIFVTGIEFLPITSTTLELVGGQVDAALVSVSVDNRIVLHKIPSRATLGFLGSFTFFVTFILLIYVVMSYFDL